MITKDKLKKVFTKICSDECMFDIVLYEYDKYLKRKAKEKGLVLGTDEYDKLFKNDEAEAVSWLVNGMLTDKVVDYIKENMEYVLIVEYPEDEYLQDIIDGIKNTQEHYKDELGERFNLMPYLFDKKACRVGSTGIDSGGFTDDFYYAVGELVTYILEDGTLVVVEENRFSFDDLEGDSACIFRRVVDNESWMLDELDDLFESDYQGFFDI